MALKVIQLTPRISIPERHVGAAGAGRLLLPASLAESHFTGLWVFGQHTHDHQREWRHQRLPSSLHVAQPDHWEAYGGPAVF